jgi:4-amino-4-deoxy-L-arabinose transferase-like glycosyltransferase
VAAWVAARDDPRWYLAMTVAGAAAMLTRGVAGLAVPVTLLAASVLDRRAWRHMTPALVLMAAPLACWYAWLIWLHGGYFWEVQREFLAKGIGAGTTGTWRRYTGAPEYLWMLAQSYWPWLPFLAIGIYSRWRDRELAPLAVWALTVFAACSLGGGRVLRYLLPAYPAFAIFAAAGLMRVVPEGALRTGIRWAAPLAAAAALAVALFPPENLHAAEIRPIAAAAASVTGKGERIGFYDQGVARFDETNQIQWYGGRTLWILTDAEMFDKALAEPWANVWIVDRATFDARFASRSGAQIVAESGHLVCVRLT